MGEGHPDSKCSRSHQGMHHPPVLLHVLFILILQCFHFLVGGWVLDVREGDKETGMRSFFSSLVLFTSLQVTKRVLSRLVSSSLVSSSLVSPRLFGSPFNGLSCENVCLARPHEQIKLGET